MFKVAVGCNLCHWDLRIEPDSKYNFMLWSLNRFTDVKRCDLFVVILRCGIKSKDFSSFIVCVIWFITDTLQFVWDSWSNWQVSWGHFQVLLKYNHNSVSASRQITVFSKLFSSQESLFAFLCMQSRDEAWWFT